MPKSQKKVVSAGIKGKVRSRSIVWTYLEKLDAKRAYCTLCPKEIKHYGNTANAMQHLRRVHPQIFFGATTDSPPPVSAEPQKDISEVTEVLTIATTTEEQPPLEYVSVSSSDFQTKYIEVVQQPQSPPPPKKPSIKRNVRKATVERSPSPIQESSPQSKAIVRMICKDLHSPSIVDDEGFRDLMEELNCNLPTREHLANTLIPAKYKEVCATLKEMLILASQITISYDAWIVEDTRTFLTITAHFISLGQLRSSVLSTKEILDVNPADNLAKCVWAELQNWGIEYKVNTVVTADDESLVQSVELLEMAYLPCIGTILEQCAIEVFLRSPVDELTEKCRQLVAYCKCNEVRLALEKQQDDLGEARFPLISEDSRRWLSIWKMLERLLLLKDHLQTISDELTDCPEPPTDAEWNVINDVVALLKQFELMADTELAVERYPTLPKMIPLINGLRYTIQNYPTISSQGQHIKEHLIESINTRLGYLETSEIACKATLLDPRFKNLLFDDGNQTEAAERALEMELIDLFRADAAQGGHAYDKVNYKHIDTPSLWSQLDKKIRKSILNNKTTPEENARAMLQQYLNKAIVARMEDPLDFWRAHKEAFPQLYELAVKYLCVPALALPSELLYTKRGLRFKEKRIMLGTEEIMDQLIFLNSNIDLTLDD